jgi:hypothetical protein
MKSTIILIMILICQLDPFSQNSIDTIETDFKTFYKYHAKFQSNSPTLD